jgi:hypothetical protein
LRSVVEWEFKLGPLHCFTATHTLQVNFDHHLLTTVGSGGGGVVG